MWTTPRDGLIYEQWFKAAEKRFHLPTGLISRVAYQESRYKPDAKNPSGATGIMQMIPKWHPGVDVLDPVDSILAAAQYLAKLYNDFGTIECALAAYNWGPGNLAKVRAKFYRDWRDHMPQETQSYVRDILKDLEMQPG
jgi:soluble lytic murein transglycosylase-like protein